MPTPAELEADFWSALKSDQTVMLSCDGAPPRPMAAQVEDDRAPIWFFTSTMSDIGQALSGGPKPGTMTFASKGHDLWASASGMLVHVTDGAVIDRLWTPQAAAWFEEGRDDPKLCLVRFDAGGAHLWEDASSFVAGIKSMLGADPKEDYDDKTAQVRLDD